MYALRLFSVSMGLFLVLVLGLPACSPEVELPHVTLEQARAEHEAGMVLMPMSEWAKRGWPMVKPQDLVGPSKS